MKLVVPAFLLGASLGIAGTWFALRPEAPASKPAVTANSTEQAEVSRLRQLVASQKDELTTLKDQLQELASAPSKSGEDKDKEGLGGMMAKLMEGDQLTKMMETQAKNERRAKVERLSGRLKLTPEQRASLEAFIEKRDQARIAQMQAFQKSPLMKKMFSGQELTEEEQKEMERMQDFEKPSSLKDWTKENLTPEQASSYDRYQLERKAAQAEASATQQLNQLSAIVDLSEDQKDRVFKHYSDQAMKAPLFDELEGMPTGVMVAGGEGVESATVTSSVTIGHGDNAQEADPLKTILTPEQFETYKAHQDEQRKAQEEMMKALGLPDFGKPKGGQKK